MALTATIALSTTALAAGALNNMGQTGLVQDIVSTDEFTSAIIKRCPQ